MPETLQPTQVFRFDQMAVQVKDKVEPAEADVDRYVGLEHIDPESLKIRRWGETSDVESSKILFKSGDIIFGKRRAYQRKLAVADFDGICSAHAMVLRPKTDVVLEEFLPFFMQSDIFMDRAVKISVGGLSPTINWRDLAKEEFALPALEDQSQIAEVLQAARQAYERLTTLTDQARIAWLSILETLRNDRRLEARTVGDLLADIVPGRSLVGNNQPPHDDEVAVLKVSAVDPLGFRPEESKVLNEPSQFISEFGVNKGDLLMTRANTPALVGETCIVDRGYPNLMLCDKTLRLVPAVGVSKRLLWHLMQSQSMRQQISAVSTGTGGAMKNISQAKIKALPLPFPTTPEVAAGLCESLDQCFEAVRSSAARAEAAKELLRALLRKVLEGPA